MMVWFYEDNPFIKLFDLRIDLVTSSGNYYYKYVAQSTWTGHSGAIRIRYDLSQFTKKNNPDLSNITKINIHFTGQSGMMPTLGIFWFTYNAKGDWYNPSTTGKVLKITDRPTIENARTVYNALTTDQKTLVTNVSKLTDLEAKMSELQSLALAKTKAEISALPPITQLNLADSSAVATAREDYDTLSPSNQLLVTNYSVLQNAEAKILQIETDAANNVTALITALPPTSALSLTDKPQVFATKAAYDALNDNGKALVANAALLLSAVAKLSSIDVQNVSSLINALPDTYGGIPLIDEVMDDRNYSNNALPLTNDNSVTFNGEHPVKITSATTGNTPTEFGKAYNQALDLSDLTNVELLLWFYENDPKSKLSGMRIDLVTNANNFYYLYVDTSYWNGSSGVSRMRYDISHFQKNGNPDLSHIIKFNIRFTGVSGMTPSLGVFSVTYNARSVPKVLLTLDDGWQDNYDNAFPVLEANGFKATTYVVSSFVQGNDPNYMRKSTLDKLYAAGWDIGNHSSGHENYLIDANLTTAQMAASYQTCLDYLLTCGYTKSARFVCYPSGGFDDNLIALIKNMGIVSARTTRIGMNADPIADVYKLKQVYVGPDTTFGADLSATDIKASIDTAIATGQTLAIMMHRISLDSQLNVAGDSTNPIKTSVSKFTQIVGYLKQTGAQVCTMSEWYNGLATTKTLSIAERANIENTRAAYDALTAGEKALIPNYKKLTEIEAAINVLEPVSFTDYHANNKKITNVAPNTTAFGFLSEAKANKGVLVLKDATGNTLKNNDKVGTGTIVDLKTTTQTIDYMIDIFGDVDGDGDISVSDLASVKRHLLKQNLLLGEYFKAGDIYNAGAISISDLLAVKKYILGIGTINQNR